MHFFFFQILVYCNLYYQIVTFVPKRKILSKENNSKELNNDFNSRQRVTSLDHFPPCSLANRRGVDSQ